jgi:hypothetical protein
MNSHDSNLTEPAARRIKRMGAVPQLLPVWHLPGAGGRAEFSGQAGQDDRALPARRRR